MPDRAGGAVVGMTRRELLKSFTAGLAALSVPGLIWQERRTQGRSVPVEPDPPVTGGIPEEEMARVDASIERAYSSATGTVFDMRQAKQRELNQQFSAAVDRIYFESVFGKTS